MFRIRTKLLVVVALCVGPAVLAAILGARRAEQDLLDEVRARLDDVDQAFTAQLTEGIQSAKLALRLASEESRLAERLALHSAGPSGRVLRALHDAYPQAAVLIADGRGEVIESSGVARAPQTIAAEQVPALSRVWSGEEVSVLTPVAALGERLTIASPLVHEGSVVGAVVLALPVDRAYLDGFRQRIFSEFAVQVNGEVVAVTGGHLDPAGGAMKEGRTPFRRGSDGTFAVNTFRPAALQAPGREVVVSAAVDVSRLRAKAIGSLLVSLTILSAVSLVAILVAVTIARRIGDATARIAKAAGLVSGGRYERVEVLHTRDELESLSRTFNEMVGGLEERDRIRDTFGQYVSRQVADRILAGRVNLGGELIEVTILFADIRGFTTLSERMDPRELIELLNLYFTGMVDTLMKHHGVVDKFIGDAIMAVFGAPTPQDDDARNAVEAAIDMRQTLRRLNAEFAAAGRPELKIGIGVHTGPVVAGNIGHTQRKQYTVIGDPVNVASRLEGLTKQFPADILLSEDTYARVAAHVRAEPLERTRVKGRDEAVLVYRLLGSNDDATAAA